MSDLDKLLPSPITIKVGDEELIIKPFPFGKLPEVLKKLSGLTSYLEKGDMIGLATEGGDAVISLMALAVKKDVAWFDDLDPGIGIDILTQIVLVNKSFFVQKVQPRLLQMGLVKEPDPEPTGETSLQPSSDTDTAGAISSNTP